jgi:hypothetical protein
VPEVPAIEVKDAIAPTVVEHRNEAALHAETRELLYSYNYFYYRFDVAGGEVWARSYLDETDHVSLFLPKGMELADEDAQRVLSYLILRFPRIQMLTEAGYVTVWPKDREQPN